MPNKVYTNKYWGVAGSPIVYEQTNASLKQVGNELPASLETVSNFNAYPLTLNRTVNFEGELYTVQNEDVYKLSPSGTWEVDFTSITSAQQAGQFGVIGLFPVLLNQEDPYLYYVRKGTSANVVITRKSSPISAGGNWDTEAVTAITTWGRATFANDTAHSALLNNILYFRFLSFDYQVSSTLCFANLATKSVGDFAKESVPIEANVNASDFSPAGAMELWNGKLYYTMSTIQFSTGPRLKENYLYEVVGAVSPRKAIQINKLQQPADTALGLLGDNNTHHRDGLVAKDGNLYAIVYATGWEGVSTGAVSIDSLDSPGWGMYKIVNSGNEIVLHSEITDTVLPQELRRVAGMSGAPNGVSWNGRWTTQHQVDESGVERVYLYYANNGFAGSLVNIYEFIDDTQPLQLIDVGLDASLSNASYRRGGGNYEIQPAKTFPVAVRQGQVAGTVDIDVTIVGTGQPLLFGMLYNSDNEAATTLMNLVATTSGTIINGGTAVSGLLAGDTGNLMTLTWAAEAQGVEFAIQTAINPILTLL